MKPAGLISIKIAKQNGSWKLLNSVEALRMPEDLKLALKTAFLAKRYYSRLSRSSKKILLQWLVLARTEKTRVLRISDIVASLSDATLPKPFRQQGRNILEDKISGN